VRFLSKEAHWKLDRESMENQEDPDLADPLERRDRFDPQLDTDRPDPTE